MALVINTNILSLTAQRNLTRSQGPLQQAMQRLSSGFRVNSAKDDAAGLAIATRQTRQIRGLGVAIRNANDGISFAQTAEGSMDEMLNSMQRINELAIQAASNNTSTDRNSMNTEVQQLIDELNRIVAQTRFNGDQFLNQSKSVAVQVGVEVNETITISTSNVSPNSFGVESTRGNFDDTTANINAIASSNALVTLRSSGLSDSATIGGVDLGDAVTATESPNNTLNIINRINEKTATHNVTAFSFGNAYVGTAAIAEVGSASFGTAGAVNSGYLNVNGIAIGSTATVTDHPALASAMVTAINAKTASTGVTAVILGSVETNAASTYSIALVNTNGASITVSVATANAGLGSGQAAFFGTGSGSVSAGQNGQIVFTTPLGTTSVTTNAASENMAFGFSTGAASIALANSQSVNDVSVTTVGNANLAVLSIKQGLDTINSERATLGAATNRLESTISNLGNVRENVQAARSRIIDADFAAETANLTRALILQQAGITILAQANSVPQQVLALLQ